MAFYGNKWLLKENVMNQQRYKNYKTDLKFKGLNIEIDVSINNSNENPQLINSRLEKDIKILSRYFDKLIKEEFGKLLDTQYSEMNYNVSDIIKMIELTEII